MGLDDPRVRHGLQEVLRLANENRLGTEDQVIRYCTETTPPSEKLFGAPNPPSGDLGSNVCCRVVRSWVAVGYGRGRGCYSSLEVHSPWLGLSLDVVPQGLMCAVATTFSFFLCSVSSVLAHMSRPQQNPAHWPSWSQRDMYGGALFCGYAGKALAIASGV